MRLREAARREQSPIVIASLFALVLATVEHRGPSWPYDWSSFISVSDRSYRWLTWTPAPRSSAGSWVPAIIARRVRDGRDE